MERRRILIEKRTGYSKVKDLLDYIFIILTFGGFQFLLLQFPFANKNFFNLPLSFDNDFVAYISSNQFVEPLVCSAFIYILTLFSLSFCVGYVIDSDNGFLFTNCWRRFLFLLLRSFVIRIIINLITILIGNTHFSTPISIAMEAVYTIVMVIWAFGFENKDFYTYEKVKHDYCNYNKIFKKSQIKIYLILFFVFITIVFIGVCTSYNYQENYNYVLEKYNNIDMSLLQNNLNFKNSVSHFFVSWTISSICGLFLLYGLKSNIKIKRTHKQPTLLLVMGRLVFAGFCCFVMIVAVGFFQFIFFGRTDIGLPFTQYSDLSPKIQLGAQYKIAGLSYDDMVLTNNIEIKTYTYKKVKSETMPFNPLINVEDRCLGKFKFDSFIDKSAINSFLEAHHYPDLPFDNQVIERYALSYINQTGKPTSIKTSDINKQKEDINLTTLIEYAINEGYFDYIEYGSEYLIKYDTEFIVPILQKFSKGEIDNTQLKLNKNINQKYMIEFCKQILQKSNLKF